MKFRIIQPWPDSMSEFQPVRYEDAIPFEASPVGYVSALRECGLFSGLPDVAFQLNVESVSRNFGDKFMHPCLYGTCNGDGEWVYSEGCHAQRLAELASTAYGILDNIHDTVERWDRTGDGINITLQTNIGDQVYSHAWKYECDYASMEFYRYLDALVYSVSPDLCVKLYQQTLLVCNLEGFKRCVRRKLIPVRAYEHSLDGIEIIWCPHNV